MDRILEQALLFDFYGELLTEHQRRIYEEVVMDDCSLAEAAEDFGISRQGVHDIIKRCDRIMQGYEEKLHLVEKYRMVTSLTEKLEEMLKSRGVQNENELLELIHKIPETL